MCHFGSTVNMLVTVPHFFRFKNKQHCPGHDSPQPPCPFGSHELLFSKNGTPQRFRRQRIFLDFETPDFILADFYFSLNIFLSDELQYLSWTEVVLLTVLPEPSDSALLCVRTLCTLAFPLRTGQRSHASWKSYPVRMERRAAGASVTDHTESRRETRAFPTFLTSLFPPGWAKRVTILKIMSGLSSSQPPSTPQSGECGFMRKEVQDSLPWSHFAFLVCASSSSLFYIFI